MSDNRYEPMPTEGKIPVTNSVILDLREREQLGISKYGTSLYTNNGRVAVRDAYQESLDCAQYLKQHLLENQEYLLEIERLRCIITEAHDALRYQNTAAAFSILAAEIVVEGGHGHVRVLGIDNVATHGSIIDGEATPCDDSASQPC